MRDSYGFQQENAGEVVDGTRRGVASPGREVALGVLEVDLDAAEALGVVLLRLRRRPRRWLRRAGGRVRARASRRSEGGMADWWWWGVVRQRGGKVGEWRRRGEATGFAMGGSGEGRRARTKKRARGERMEAGGGWKMSMRTDLGFRLGWVWAVGSGSIRRWLMRDPHDMLMVQSERSKPFYDLMTI